MPDTTLKTESWRLAAYRALARRLNRFFERFVAPGCRDCRRVLARLPGGGDRHRLVAGVFPGCCHRGAGDIFRLEGVKDEAGGDGRLAPVLAAELQAARQRHLAAIDHRSLPPYELEEPESGRRISGEHCCYMGPRGCVLGELKGPLCLNFVCPPIRDDLLAAAGDVELVGPEHDFLGIYRVMDVIGRGREAAAEAALTALGDRLARLTDACEKGPPFGGKRVTRRIVS
ncbi:MAG: hypothetical protein JW781_06680 [Deltaproteobacteria bacterium]|nr:hypothetical protein [Candidatus Anaeroferrophillacea bacterium]